MLQVRSLWVVLCIFVSAARANAVELSILDDCAIIDGLHDFLSKPVVPHQDCRAPDSELERRLLAYSSPSSCFIRTTGVDKVDGSYSCLRSEVQGTQFLDCYRFTSPADIEEFKTNYADAHAADVVQYFDRAKQCARSPEGGLNVQKTAFYLPFVSVARFDFGFGSVMGPQDAMTGALTNVFAKVDPDLQRDGEAIETISLRVGAAQGLRRLEIDWASRDKTLTVLIDPLTELNAAWREMAGRLPVPLSYSGFSAEFGTGFKKSSDTLNEEKRRAVFEKVGGLVEGITDSYGFTEVDENDVETMLQRSPEEMVKEARSMQPYGLRPDNEDILTVKVFLPDNPGCSLTDGMTIAMLFQTESTSQQGSYGDLFAMVISAGECVAADRRKAARMLKEMAKDLAAAEEN